MKKQLRITDQAKADLRNIRRYIEQDNPHHARKFMADLTAKIEWIADTEFAGSPRYHIREGLRALPYRRRCIYFRSYPDHILIIRVVHGAQDVSNMAFDEG